MSTFNAKITYNGGLKYAFRMNGQKWSFRRGAAVSCNDRKVAQYCKGLGMSVNVQLGGPLFPEEEDPGPSTSSIKKKLKKKATKKK